MINVYTDGAAKGNPGPGGWGALILEEDDQYALGGWHPPMTTNNQMELAAVINALEALSGKMEITIHTDSEYVIGQAKGNRTLKNHQLVARLRELQNRHQITWKYVAAHKGNLWNEEADKLAKSMMARALREQAISFDRFDVDQSRFDSDNLTMTHIDNVGRVRMVDVSHKADTEREAIATGKVLMSPETIKRIIEGTIAKGEVLAVARIAGIMAAKRTSDLIPLCHPLALTNVEVDVEPDLKNGCVWIKGRASLIGKTGVEMESLTAVAVTALTIYDMCKSIDPEMRIGDIRLISKRGGKSGRFVSVGSKDREPPPNRSS